MGQCSCSKIDVGQLERVRENADKESKINNADCLLAARKQDSSPSPLEPGLSHTRFRHASCPRHTAAESLGQGGHDTWRGRHPVWDAGRSCSFFTLLGEQNQKGRVGKLCGNPKCLWCYPIVCFALQAIKHLLISNVAFHNLPTPSAHSLSSAGHSPLQPLPSGFPSPRDANEMSAE